MNILTAIILVFFLLMVIQGYQKGFADNIIGFTSGMIGIIVLFVLAKGLGNFLQGNMLNVIVALIILFGIRLIYKIVRLILDSCKLVSEVPVIKQIDKVAGMILGLFQGVFSVWVFFAVGGYFHFWFFEKWISMQIDDSKILSILYHTNYLVYWLSKL